MRVWEEDEREDRLKPQGQGGEGGEPKTMNDQAARGSLFALSLSQDESRPEHPNKKRGRYSQSCVLGDVVMSLFLVVNRGQWT